ncbi:MAG: hypothetical protein LBK82_08980 [Planctomycetaceae bacterium]|jgi:hypothetical protein|nr:hypothetical protein [Planctomycetaceae bacterium]
MDNVVEQVGPIVPNIDYSQVQYWSPLVFIGVATLIILATLIPMVITVIVFVIKSNNASNREQLTAQEKTHQSQTEAIISSYQTQVSGLMAHQKEQIERICNSHVKEMEATSKSFEKVVKSFDNAIERRDNQQTEIMRELRVINDKIDNVTITLGGHINSHHNE